MATQVVQQPPALSPPPPEKSLSAATIVKEFFIDFLGSLVPGFLFTMFAIPVVVWSAVICWHTIQGVTKTQPTIAIPYNFAVTFRAESLCLILVVSYVLGFVFFRRDPKIPDQRSAAYLMWKDRCVGRSAIQSNTPATPLKSRWPIVRWAGTLWRAYWRAKRLAESEGGQFPYSHLYEYLNARGLDHIADLVPWRGSTGVIDKRSKMFINILKMRLQYADPQRCGEIVRNEAHVRMMSSVWYAARLLQQLCLLLLIPLAVCSYLMRAWRSPDIWGLLLVLLVLVLGTQWLRRTIIKFLHYQRVREIVYVLETAYISEKLGRIDIFSGFEFQSTGKQGKEMGVAAGI